MPPKDGQPRKDNRGGDRRSSTYNAQKAPTAAKVDSRQRTLELGPGILGLGTRSAPTPHATAAGAGLQNAGQVEGLEGSALGLGGPPALGTPTGPGPPHAGTEAEAADARREAAERQRGAL